MMDVGEIHPLGRQEAACINGLVQDCGNSIGDALEIRQSCTEPLALNIIKLSLPSLLKSNNMWSQSISRPGMLLIKFAQNILSLTPKKLEMHGCLLSTVATDALTLTISIHNADKILLV